MAGKTVRSAIYTRKSSEEGLEQAFNSLDAQREACAAYIRSQRHEGWTEVTTGYDDGGLSGGTLQRPALQRLLADIAAGLIDNVVVYKVDRLTRSLADFAKIVDVFDAHSVSFVSVTQQFNTTTSMGRLTLNMLLSFAQFEREVTGERIRDKIAASKQKGMWMGGLPPLGYDAADRQLRVNEAEAATVRHIFDRYRTLGSVDALCRELAQEGIRNKTYRREHSSTRGGGPLQRGALYRMLQNPIYRGQIRHKEQVHPGQHAAIIGEELWQAVQATLAANRIADANKTNARAPSLLAGKVWTEAGEPFTPSHANNSGKRYRYYVSRASKDDAHADNHRWRVPAGALEGLVTGAIAGLLSDTGQMRSILDTAGIAAIQQQGMLDRAAAWAQEVQKTATAEHRTRLRGMIARIVVAEACITVSLSVPALSTLLGSETSNEGAATTDQGQTHDIVLPVRLQRAGMEIRLIDERTVAREPDPALVRLLTRAWTIRAEVLKGNRSLDVIAEEHGIGSSYLARLLRLAFLAPDIVETILRGKQPLHLTANRLANMPTIPTDWNEQRRLILGTSNS